MRDDEAALSRTAASRAVESIGWRYLLGTLATSVAVSSLDDATHVAAAALAAVGDRADRHLRIDLRPDRVELSVQYRARGVVTATDVELASAITESLTGAGHATGGATGGEPSRPVQALELAIDALDIPAIRPFWAAVLAYVDEPGDKPDPGLVDPAGQLPTLWFQQMDEPRPERNRIHLDVTVAHDEADRRVEVALAAGGVLVDDSEAPSFRVLADAEGNEVCVCTWSGRDEHDS